MQPITGLLLILSILGGLDPKAWANTVAISFENELVLKREANLGRCEAIIHETGSPEASRVLTENRDPLDTMKEVLSVQSHLESEIIDQNEMVEGMLMAMLTGGHILLVGPHGTGKSVGAIALGSSVKGTF